MTAPDQAGPEESEPGASGDEGTAGDPLTYVALAVGALGVLLGGFGLVRGRRSP